MGSKSKNKGKGFERDVAQFLSEQHEYAFMRTAHSGAFTGKSNSVRLDSMDSGLAKAFIGDIAQPKGISLVVECKNYAEMRGGFHSIVNGTSGQIAEWLDEVEFDSKTEVPYMLVFKINNSGGMYFVLPLKWFDVLQALMDSGSAFTYFPVEGETEEIITDYVIVNEMHYESIAHIIGKAIKTEKVK